MQNRKYKRLSVCRKYQLIAEDQVKCYGYKLIRICNKRQTEICFHAAKVCAERKQIFQAKGGQPAAF